ncbi:helix-turn-helix domain-containing protein [Mesorhizobium sp. AR02]|uniref:helix-turn-helix domain-containing protein n=1 Tax=Mesorhizobium sp. AR02 TaxID=2865837 RepID=UPI0021600D46|nr:helix-turn-helix transcriptional regulator [Mesorhizobium sp. AR02]UVK55351.1 helix-turn-helix domain-containing protein [Mesorhizobium sp. AR02]
MDVRQLVAWNLRRLRVANNISQDELALRAEVESAYVGHLERATKNPTIETLERLADALKAPISELFVEPSHDQKRPEPLRAGRRRGER